MMENGQPQGADPAGIVRQVKDFFAACARYASARMRLASIEGREAAGEAGKVLLLAGAVLVAGAFGWLFLCLGAVFLLAKAMGEYGWVWASLIVGCAHIVIAILLGLVLRAHRSKSFFPLTTAEFQKDREWLEEEKK